MISSRVQVSDTSNSTGVHDDALDDFVFWIGAGVIVMGIVDLVTACLLGSQGLPVNQFYGGAMFITAVLVIAFAWFFWKTNITDEQNKWGAPWGRGENAFMIGLGVSAVITFATAFLILGAGATFGLLGWTPLANLVLCVATPTVAYGLIPENQR